MADVAADHVIAEVQAIGVHRMPVGVDGKHRAEARLGEAQCHSASPAEQVYEAWRLYLALLGGGSVSFYHSCLIPMIPLRHARGGGAIGVPNLAILPFKPFPLSYFPVP